ncbi:ABC transporter substrate-binding protein [Streptomyces sp. PT12]|uniref:ABC transporter substrate-binding protein n=1 Tax=Streptomyces sp. PT12 TaxID=1510197 RepID=UPI000DE50690|nr:ABC transporter substrate-binding protein [Streptomyces sp. PT12]RBM19068.1 ABC transporter substrate-binding protein [Streptomyces sp. PT12]
MTTSLHGMVALQSLRGRATTALLLGAALLLAACGPPGAGNPGGPGPQEPATRLPAVSGPLRILVSTPDVPLYEALAEEFEAEHPDADVTVDSEDYATLITNAPRILSTSNPPDIIKLGSFGNLVKDEMIISLDGYAEAYGWDDWPPSQFLSARVAADGGTRGTGSLYAVGPGFGLTGVYYNTSLAGEIGMSQPPESVSEFEDLLDRAREKGLLPMMVNGKDGGTAFLLQNLQMGHAGTSEPMQAWTFNQPGADIDTEPTVQAAAALQAWAADGYLPDDVNSIDQSAAPIRFTEGEGVFFPSGNWHAPGLDESSGDFGFFLFPPMEEGGPYSAMTAGSNLAISARSEHPQEAAAFLDFVQTDASARELTVRLGGLIPAGPESAPMPATERGSAVSDTVAAFGHLVASDGLVDFMANATASIQVSTIVPSIQSLLAGRITPEELASQLEDGYERELGR